MAAREPPGRVPAGGRAAAISAAIPVCSSTRETAAWIKRVARLRGRALVRQPDMSPGRAGSIMREVCVQASGL